MTAHRADLHGMLRAALPEDIIRLDANCVGATTRNGVAVARFADGSEVEGDAVIGADGIRSAIRAQIVRRRRAALHRDDVLALHGADGEGPDPRSGRTVRSSLAHGEYFGWIGPNGHVICYPIGDRVRCSTFSPVTSPTNGSRNPGRRRARSRNCSTPMPAGTRRCSACSATSTHVYKWGIYDRDPVPQWTQGRVTLLGDAAHPTMPTLAQGGNMAIEDGYVLARNLARHDDESTPALAGYVGRAAAAHRPRHAAVAPAVRQQPQGAAAAVPRPHLDFHLRRDERAGNRGRPDRRWRR